LDAVVHLLRPDDAQRPIAPHHRLTEQLQQGSQTLKGLLALSGSSAPEALPAGTTTTTAAVAAAAAAAGTQEGSPSHGPHAAWQTTACCCH
jgi:hypothetical protein